MLGLFQTIKQKYVDCMNLKDPKFFWGREEQEHILNSIADPKDNIERSYNQFKCQFLIHSINHNFLQIAGFFMLYYRILTTPKRTEVSEKCDMVCILAGIGKSRVPLSLIERYKHVRYCTDIEHYVLNKDDYRWFVKNIRKNYPFEFFFQLKIFLRMTQYRYLMDKYRPSAISTHSEYSCGSSAMTEFCNIQGIKHINFMHGDKVWGIRDSFFRFDECYVWHEHYKKMFVSLKAFPDQFIIELPPEFFPGKVEIKEKDRVDYCYYFQDECHQEIDFIVKCLKALKRRGHRIRMRLHPRWSDGEYIRGVVEDTEMEIEPREMDINYSILTSGHAVSKFSTVLLQSHFLQIPVIIDDCSNVHKFKQIAEYDYIMLSLEHSLLSQILGNDLDTIKKESI